ncbi:heme-binding protein 2 [Hydra vulgaris]|uniref:Heme-binding protein 2 n=1 Tax=Hydra vulgaris TaxID=6087 RepID=A0ABM4DPC3_HYDVU
MGIIISYFSDDALKNKVETDYIKPKIYGKLDGPVFINLDYNNIYATRHYDASLWVSTVVSGNLNKAWNEGLPKLKEYINGKNQKKWVLPKPCIVTLKRTCSNELNAKLNLNSSFTETNKTTVSMFISKHFSCEAPGPLDSTVFLQEEYKRIYYCGIFNGQNFAEENTDKYFQILHAKLMSNKETFDKHSFFIAFYNIKTKKIGKQKYFECWLYGERIESDFKCLKTYQEESNELEESKVEMDNDAEENND